MSDDWAVGYEDGQEKAVAPLRALEAIVAVLEAERPDTRRYARAERYLVWEIAKGATQP